MKVNIHIELKSDSKNRSGTPNKRSGVCSGCGRKILLADLYTMYFIEEHGAITSYCSSHYCMECLKLIRDTLNFAELGE